MTLNISPMNSINTFKLTYDTLIEFNSRSMALFPVTADEIAKIVCGIKNNKNIEDILPSFYIKKCQDILAQPIADSINNYFLEGTFPIELKTSRIIPIYKNGDCLQPVNYKSIFFMTYPKFMNCVFIIDYLIFSLNSTSLTKINLVFRENQELCQL